MGKNRFLAATLLGAVVALAALPATPAGTVPLPPDIKIAAPDPDVPPQRAAYLGKWTGTWDGILPTVLVVERVTAGSAETIYAWGVAPRWKISSPGWVRTTGQFANGVLRLSLRLPTTVATVTYRMLPDGTLDATYLWQGYKSHAKMVREKE
jgi:hypothetical protein